MKRLIFILPIILASCVPLPTPLVNAPVKGRVIVYCKSCFVTATTDIDRQTDTLHTVGNQLYFKYQLNSEVKITCSEVARMLIVDKDNRVRVEQITAGLVYRFDK